MSSKLLLNKKSIYGVTQLLIQKTKHHPDISMKIALRPTCYYDSEKNRDQVFKKIKQQLNESTGQLEGVVIQDYAFIRIAKSFQHYWSPELQITVREDENNNKVRALYGPKPIVWTMFMFFYGLVLSISFFGGIYGFIQWWLDMPAPFLWFIPGGFAGLILVYAAALYGQYKGKEQMEILKKFFQDILE